MTRPRTLDEPAPQTFNRIICADVLDGLRELPDRCVQTCVTSPPYWGLRDYGVEGQLGLESTVEAWVANMVEVFNEVRRVLRDDGTLWLNLGDSYASAWPCHRVNAIGNGSLPNGKREARASNLSGVLKEKDLVGQPWRVAFALQADGWYLRSDIIWHKPNPMPESVTDRPTKSHEYVFLLSKRADYYYDAEAVREPNSSAEQLEHNMRYAKPYEAYDSRGGPDGTGQPGNENNRGIHARPGTTGRNLRSVWTIPTEPYPEAHFATFPTALVKPCILAGTSAKGACAECGAPWEREVETGEIVAEPGRETSTHGPKGNSNADNGFNDGNFKPGHHRAKWTTCWRPTCDHGAETVPCLVLDPFAGSGTTLAVAQELGRSYVGVELNPAYVELAGRRLATTPTALPLAV